MKLYIISYISGQAKLTSQVVNTSVRYKCSFKLYIHLNDNIIGTIRIAGSPGLNFPFIEGTLRQKNRWEIWVGSGFKQTEVREVGIKRKNWAGNPYDPQLWTCVTKSRDGRD